MPETRFFKMEDEAVLAQIKKNEEFLGILRVLAANSVGHTAQGKVDDDQLHFHTTEIIEGEKDDSPTVAGMILGSIGLLKHFPNFVALFDACALIPANKTTVQETVKLRKKIIEAERKEKRDSLREGGVNIIEIPGLGFAVEVDLSKGDVFKEILDKIFQGSDTKRPH